ncbi:enolase C-terminal domain-like protein [Blastococcus sp. BMG 814]|uniref:Enolase C-terminal domain-like protein n=1 Tax=Blastococcus carthaginiensis TaxID=3050034 RepID=A0ABT9I933_9ACTN|nr:enolase C-terminal domain-like protein [Blastococcus carthaginiensis]MDP5181674.1 enolase C-terminal domain-like protein [Blastococcus carthaginiensis]
MTGPSSTPTVDAVDVSVFVVPTEGPEADGTLTWDSTTCVLVQVSGGGRTGLGWTYGPAACATLITDVLADVVRGRPAPAVPAAWEAMVRRCRNAGRPGLVSMAVAAVDTALWDLAARLLDVPLVVLLGQVHDDVAVYGSGGFPTWDEATSARHLEHWVGDLGMSAVKIKIGESWGQQTGRDLDRVRRARDVVGSGVEVFVDANGGYTPGQARRVGRALDDLGVTWFEEPVSSDDLDGLAGLRAVLDTDVAAGEYAYDLAYVQRMCVARAVDCMQLDVTRVAGITEFRRAAAVAAGAGLEVSAHCAPALHAHVAASVPNLRHVEHFVDHARLEPMLFDGVPEVRGGRMRSQTDRPGNGLRLRPDAERYRSA